MFNEFPQFQKALRILAEDSTVEWRMLRNNLVSDNRVPDIAGCMATKDHIIYQKLLTKGDLNSIMYALTVQDISIKDRIADILLKSLPEGDGVLQGESL